MADIEILGHISVLDEGSAVLERFGMAANGLALGVAAAVGGLVVGAFVELTRAVGDFLNQGFQLDTLLERSAVIFESFGFAAQDAGKQLLNVSDKGASMLDFAQNTETAQARLMELFNYTAYTPFKFADVINANKEMLVFGGTALATMANLKMFGDAAADTNNTIQKTAFWAGRLYDALQGGQPISQATLYLERMGIISGETAGQLKKMQKEGIDGATIWQTFTASLDRFKGATDALATSWTGRLTTMKDNLTLFSSVAVKPFQIILEQLFGMINDFAASDTFKTWFVNAQAALKLFQGDMARLFADLKAGDFKSVMADMKSGLTDLFGSDTATRIMGVIQWLIDHFNDLKIAAELLGTSLGSGILITAIAGIVALLGTLLSPIVAISLAIGILSTAWINDWGGIREKFAGVWKDIQPGLQDLKKWLDTNIPGAIAWLKDKWENDLLPALRKLSDWTAGPGHKAFTDITTFLGTGITVGAHNAATAWDTFMAALKRFSDWTAGPGHKATMDLLTWLSQGIVAGAGVAKKAFDDLWVDLQGIWAWISKTFTPMWLSVQNTLAVIVVAAVKALQDAWLLLLNTALIPVYNELTVSLAKAWNDLIGYFGSVEKGIGTLADALIKTLAGAFDVVIKSVENLIKKIGEAIQALANLANIHIPAIGSSAGAATPPVDNLSHAIGGIKVPPAMRQTSPSPLESALTGIAYAASAANVQLDMFNGLLGMGGRGQAPAVYNNPTTNQWFTMNVQSSASLLDLTGKFGLMQSLAGIA